MMMMGDLWRKIPGSHEVVGMRQALEFKDKEAIKNDL